VVALPTLNRLLRNPLLVQNLFSFARPRGLGMFWHSRNPSLATGATLCRPLTRAEGHSMPFILRLADRFRNSL